MEDHDTIVSAAHGNGWRVKENPLRGGLLCRGCAEFERKNTLIVCQFDGEYVGSATKYWLKDGWRLSVTVSDPDSGHIVVGWLKS